MWAVQCLGSGVIWGILSSRKTQGSSSALLLKISRTYMELVLLQQGDGGKSPWPTQEQLERESLEGRPEFLVEPLPLTIS